MFFYEFNCCFPMYKIWHRSKVYPSMQFTFSLDGWVRHFQRCWHSKKGSVDHKIICMSKLQECQCCSKWTYTALSNDSSEKSRKHNSFLSQLNNTFDCCKNFCIDKSKLLMFIKLFVINILGFEGNMWS